MTFSLEKIVTVVPELSNSPLGSEYNHVGVYHTRVEIIPLSGLQGGIAMKVNVADFALKNTPELIRTSIATSLLDFLKKIPENTAWVIGYSGPLVSSVPINKEHCALITSYAGTALIPRK